MNKCTGIMGRIFGHKYIPVITKSAVVGGAHDFEGTAESINMWLDNYREETFNGCICQRCGAVTGEKK